MTDATAAEVPAELKPVPSAPEAAELETTAPDAAPQEDAAPADKPDQAPGDRIELERPTGGLRQAIIDHLVDTAEAGPQSVADILQAMPAGVSRNTLEGGLRRALAAQEVERVGPGLYVLGKPRPAEPSKPAPPSAPEPEAEPEPVVDEHAAALARDAERKRLARERDRQAAAARQAEADQALHVQLLEATCGNHTPELVAGGDVSTIKAALELVPLNIVTEAIASQTDRGIYKLNEPAVSWREPRLLRAIALRYTQFVLIDRLVQEWGKARTPPRQPADASDDAAAGQLPPDPENAPAPFPPAPEAVPAGGLSDLVEPVDLVGLDPPGDEPPAPVPASQHIEGRASILAAFRRGAAPPQPAPQPQAPRPVAQQQRPGERTWFAGPREPERREESGMTDDAWRFLLEGYRVGNVAWARKHGPPPEAPDCRVPRRILKAFGFATFD
jgi:hypothetical protein